MDTEVIEELKGKQNSIKTTSEEEVEEVENNKCVILNLSARVNLHTELFHY